MAELILKAMVEIEFMTIAGWWFSPKAVPSASIRYQILTNSVCVLLHHVGFHELYLPFKEQK